MDNLKTKDGNVTECPNKILNEIKCFIKIFTHLHFRKMIRSFFLLNIDYKIMTKSIAKRLEKVIDKLIHPNQVLLVVSLGKGCVSHTIESNTQIGLTKPV